MNKLDVARRQLLAAIHIRWYLNEPLAVYTLAANAREVADALLQKAQRKRLIQMSADSFGCSIKDVAKLINAPRNFMKHADNDPDDVMDEVTDADCDAIVTSACIDYMMAAKRSHIMMGLFLGWHSAIYPDKTGDFFRHEADALFPDLATMDKQGQLAAARALAAKQVSSDVLNDSRNELTDNYRWVSLRKHGAIL